jgi:hypothetical protein
VLVDVNGRTKIIVICQESFHEMDVAMVGRVEGAKGIPVELLPFLPFDFLVLCPFWAVGVCVVNLWSIVFG